MISDDEAPYCFFILFCLFFLLFIHFLFCFVLFCFSCDRVPSSDSGHFHRILLRMQRAEDKRPLCRCV